MVGIMTKKNASVKDEDDREDNDVMKESEEDHSGEEENEEDEDEDEEEDTLLTEPNKKAIYDAERLQEKLHDIEWPDNVDWTHELSITYDPIDEIDVNDDLLRETAFFNQALEGTKQAFEKLQSMNRPFLRPPDYYAEMVKTDAHMLKVKDKLLYEKKQLEEAEERRKAREAKKISKEVQAQKQKERAKLKKEEIESVKKWRKQRQRSGFEDGQDDLDFDNPDPFERSKKARPNVAAGDRSGGLGGKRKGKPGKNKETKKEKFGFGGKRSEKRKNTTESTDDLRGFNQGGMAKNKRKK